MATNRNRQSSYSGPVKVYAGGSQRSGHGAWNEGASGRGGSSAEGVDGSAMPSTGSSTSGTGASLANSSRIAGAQPRR